MSGTEKSEQKIIAKKNLTKVHISALVVSFFRCLFHENYSILGKKDVHV